MPSEQTGGFTSTATKTTTPSSIAGTLFINASGRLPPELGQLADDDAYRRWQARMVCYRRDGKSPRPNKHKKNRHHHSGQSRWYHQGQDQVNCHNDNTYTSDHHGGVILPTTPYCIGIGRGHTVSPAGLPIKQNDKKAVFL